MFGTHLSRLGSVHRLGLVHKAIGILRKYGTNAHVYLPGVGTISGITAANYLDSAGTTTASVDNPVGLSLDALQAMTLGLNVVVNGDFATDSVWSKGPQTTIAGGEATIASTGAASTLAQSGILDSTKTYLATFDATVRSGTAKLENGAGGTYLLIDSTKSYSCCFTGSAGVAFNRVTACDIDIDNVVFREIPGIHATQATTANKPILRRGLLNLLAQSQSLSVSPWANGGTSPTITENAGLSASGLMVADRVKFPSGANSIRYQNVSLVAGQPFTLAVVAKSFAGSADKFRLTANDFASNSVDLTATDSFQIFVFNFNASSSSPTAAGIRVDSALSAGDLLVDSIGLFKGTLTAQQILDAGGIPLTTTAAASNANAGRYSWQFDGSNDSLSLSAPLFQMSDDHCVIAGFNASEVNKYLFSQANSGTVSQVCSLRIENNGFPGVVWIDDAVANTLLYGPASCVGLNTVTSAIKIGNAKRFRVNGVQSGATNNTVLGTTTVNNYAIGNLNGSSFYQGSIYPVIAIKGTVSDADLLTLERFVGQLTGVSI